ncbi:hypothetical protein PMAYCL1PPCAC_07439, partial [Pristionchus mayeri]
LSRLLRLDLHSCWEVFYLDAIFSLSSVIFSIPITYLIYFFRLNKAIVTPFIKYIEQPFENAVIRAVVPENLDNSSYEMITMLAIFFCEITIIHVVTCIIYLNRRKNLP